VYFLARGKTLALASRVFSSTSQMATRSPCLPTWELSPLPLPPTPMLAKATRSLGEVPATSAAQDREAIQKPMPAAAAAVEVLRRSRREVLRVMVFIRAGGEIVVCGYGRLPPRHYKCIVLQRFATFSEGFI